MIQELLIIATSLTFLLIGYYIGRQSTPSIEKPTQSYKILPKPKKNLLEKAGIIEYASQEEIDYIESGQDKIDEARNEAFRQNFKS